MSAPAIPHRFGPYGGQYVPETLMPALAELELRLDQDHQVGVGRCAGDQRRQHQPQ